MARRPVAVAVELAPRAGAADRGRRPGHRRSRTRSPRSRARRWRAARTPSSSPSPAPATNSEHSRLRSKTPAPPAGMDGELGGLHRWRAPTVCDPRGPGDHEIDRSRQDRPLRGGRGRDHVARQATLRAAGGSPVAVHAVFVVSQATPDDGPTGRCSGARRGSGPAAHRPGPTRSASARRRQGLRRPTRAARCRCCTTGVSSVSTSPPIPDGAATRTGISRTSRPSSATPASCAAPPVRITPGREHARRPRRASRCAAARTSRACAPR